VTEARPAGQLAGKAALVTGGGRGIGAAVVAALVARGARVGVADLDEAAAKTQASRWGDSALAVGCDVADEDSVRAAVETTTRYLGAVTLLHNCAGISLHGRGDGPLPEVPLEAWQRTLEVNLTGTFLVTKHVLPGMVAAGGGAVVNTSSVAGTTMGHTTAAYSATKAGIVGLTKSLVATHGRLGVRANVICPGGVATDMAHGHGRTSAQEASLLTAIPAGRLGRPEEIADVVAFLLDPAASYVNGAVLTADGGWTT
jgi:NAD(P)-dependent dehydrogenase (short-subunit alcohol dehydrogenase family)